MTETLHLKTGETVANKESFYGSHLVYVPYEKGIDSEWMNYFEVNPKLPKVPNKLWNRLISVFYDYANQQLEVHARILYNLDTEQWKIIVPTQEVTAGSASYNYQFSVDLVTGEYLNYPVDLPDYEIIWHIHSHNTMTLKEPSSIDDKDELGTKQGYCVISNINLVKQTYTCCFTVVSNDNKNKKNNRYFISDADVPLLVDGLEYGENCQLDYQWYNQEIKKVIHRYIQQVVKATTYKQPNYSWKTDKQVDKCWNDFYWNVDDEIKDLILTFGVDAVVEAINKYTK